MREIDWRDGAIRAVELLEALGQPYYVKADLRVYLPPALVTRQNTVVPQTEARVIQPSLF